MKSIYQAAAEPHLLLQKVGCFSFFVFPFALQAMESELHSPGVLLHQSWWCSRVVGNAVSIHRDLIVTPERLSTSTAFWSHPSQQSEPLRYQSETGNGSAATLFTTVAKQGERIWIVICTLLDLCLISFSDGACHPCRAGHALADICNASAVIWASYECIHSKVQSAAVSCNALQGILTVYIYIQREIDLIYVRYRYAW